MDRRRGTRGIAAVLALGLALAASGCRPELDFGSDERSSQIDELVVTASLDAAGVFHVEQRYTFASDDGGTVAIPDLAGASSIIGGARNVTLNGAPASPSGGAFQPQLEIAEKSGTVAYDLTGAVSRYLDIAVLELGLLPSPEDASRQDPDVKLSGTLTLPETTNGLIEPHLHAGRDREVTIEGRVVRFSSRAPIWHPMNKLDVAIASSAVPFLEASPIAFLEQFRLAQSIQDSADDTLDDTLGAIDTSLDVSRWVLTALAFGIPTIFWLLVAKALFARFRRRRQAVGDVPDHLSDPPTTTDPAVVAVLEGEGRPERTAVAGTVLAMAHRKALDLQKYGDGFVLKVPLTTTATNGSETIVLAGLRERAGDDGVIEGRVWQGPISWWRGFRHDAVKRAREMGLATRWMPLAPLSAAFIGTGVGAGFFVFTDPFAYVAIIFGVQGLAVVVSLVSGWTLTDKGWRERALWHSFARYIRQQGKIDQDVGPEGVVVWGPYLVYGSVLGEARGAARPLTP